ncbi:nuclear transport factor 2 family protein [Modestobacter sp. VKM Ac-2986]|uniref:nuclear transport factor 2 family protein n=1 Tax=Modestobacter sp. VKM Ac-2986 TaxID=3004140 RepID=UPI0022AA5F4E|nr:nuclear transport factor 2 family protein [Modestobacter sp. VKM Ac-2986]MCZ2828881.1 nuclear transport factor 2 family protein [Modestobacter sp. VKM Ac-2986]
MTIPAQPTDLAALVDHHDIVDTLLRYTGGLDLADAELMTSALTEDAVVDLTPATTKIGLDFPVLAPRDTVVGALVGAVGPLDTSHSVTNARTTVDGDEATLIAYAHAMHFLPGTGPDHRRTEHAEMMNRYTTQLVRQDGTWRIRHLSIDNLWFDGDPQILVSQV